MYTHSDIWRAIDRLAQSLGYSPSGLAKKAGLDPTTFNKSKRTSIDGKPRWPSTESLSKILAVTETPMIDFFSFMDVPASLEIADMTGDLKDSFIPSDISLKGMNNTVLTRAPLSNLEMANRALKAVPVIGFAQAGSAGFFDEDGYPVGGSWDTIQIPPASPHSYALIISGDSMAPLYRDGDKIIIEPNTAPRKGDRVVVRTRHGEVMAKELISQSAGRVHLRSLNKEHQDRDFSIDEVVWMARIAWVSQ
jgi:phage repressor protein C with HTH and peptisase S24 domain